jgi:Cu-Zn family superoxide dismutase
MVTPLAVNESPESAIHLFGSGTLTTPNTTSIAITYDPDLAPIGAAMTATVISPPGESTTTEVTVSGLLPNRGYLVYAHTGVCGATAAAAGPRFQGRKAPATTPHRPSNNQRYADLSNEIWLYLRTDDAGAGTSRTSVPFTLTDRTPGSMVIHEGIQTSTGPDRAGEETDRLACLTLFMR